MGDKPSKSLGTAAGFLPHYEKWRISGSPNNAQIDTWIQIEDSVPHFWQMEETRSERQRCEQIKTSPATIDESHSKYRSKDESHCLLTCCYPPAGTIISNNILVAVCSTNLTSYSLHMDFPSFLLAFWALSLSLSAPLCFSIRPLILNI